jgi:Predicted periplasmic protein (DUF2092)
MRHLRPVRRRTTLVLTSAAIGALALAGCSGSSSGGSASGGSGQSSSSSSSSGAGNAVNAAALVSGASHSSSKLKSAHITTTSVLGGRTTNFSGVIAYHPTRLDFRIGVAGKQLREVLVDNVMYIKVPGGAGSSTKPWISVGIKQISQLSGIDLDSLLNNANADQTVQLLTKSSDVKFVGNETVGGVSTKHLSGTVDLDKVFAALNSTEKSSQKTLQSMVDQLGVKDSHIDLWVNSDDIPIKVVQTYTSKLGAGSSTMLLTGLNAPVTIKAPPASQVQRMAG